MTRGDSKSTKQAKPAKKVVQVPEVPAVVAEGWYKLTDVVENPVPDRRSDKFMNLEFWRKGTLVFVKAPKDGQVGRVEWPDGTESSFTKHNPDYPTSSQANGVLEKLEPAPLTLKMVLRKSYTDAETLLMALLEYGVGETGMTLERLIELDKHLADGVPEDRFAEMCHKHGLQY